MASRKKKIADPPTSRIVPAMVAHGAGRAVDNLLRTVYHRLGDDSSQRRGNRSMDKLFVVSDGTGRTAEQALRAALTQFDEADVEIIYRRNVRSEEEIREAIEEAAAARGFVVHTLVTDSLREYIFNIGRQHNVETIDLMGPLLARLSDRLAASPLGKPGLFGQLNKYYFRRIETMEFAIQHDDGQRSHELPMAEIVLLGVSRTFKTPLSVYLAFKGWFVANVPVILGVDLPRIVFTLPAEKIFCLDTNPGRLADLRRTRAEYLGGVTGKYSTVEHARRELAYARGLYQSHPHWRIVEVTHKPIEEIASEILSLRGRSDRKKS